jgi:RimJ/RimL family protein N-acetyltransferase
MVRPDAVDPSTVRLERGRGSKGRGDGRGGNYWHVYAADRRAGHVYVNVVDDDSLGPHASIQIQINKALQGRGIGKIAYRLAAEQSGHDTVYAHMRKSNTASRRAAEAAGFHVLDAPGERQLLMRWQRLRG